MPLHTSGVVASRQFKRKVSDGFLVADACLVQLEGNKYPYFSVTGELWDSEGWYERGEPDARMRECGQLHDRIAAAFPALLPLLALHLSDEDGAPMYAVENGWYWYEQHNSATVSGHLRVNAEELPEGMTREQFSEYVETLRPRWKEEAAAALAFLKQ